MRVPFLSFPSLVLSVICSARSSFKIKILLRESNGACHPVPVAGIAGEITQLALTWGRHTLSQAAALVHLPRSGGRRQCRADSDPTQVGIHVGDLDEGGFLSSPTAAQVHPGSPLSHLCKEGGFSSTLSGTWLGLKIKLAKMAEPQKSIHAYFV